MFKKMVTFLFLIMGCAYSHYTWAGQCFTFNDDGTFDSKTIQSLHDAFLRTLAEEKPAGSTGCAYGSDSTRPEFSFLYRGQELVMHLDPDLPLSEQCGFHFMYSGARAFATGLSENIQARGCRLQTFLHPNFTGEALGGNLSPYDLFDGLVHVLEREYRPR